MNAVDALGTLLFTGLGAAGLAALLAHCIRSLAPVHAATWGRTALGTALLYGIFSCLVSAPFSIHHRQVPPTALAIACCGHLVSALIISAVLILAKRCLGARAEHPLCALLALALTPVCFAMAMLMFGSLLMS